MYSATSQKVLFQYLPYALLEGSFYSTCNFLNYALLGLILSVIVRRLITSRLLTAVKFSRNLHLHAPDQNNLIFSKQFMPPTDFCLPSFFKASMHGTSPRIQALPESIRSIELSRGISELLMQSVITNHAVIFLIMFVDSLKRIIKLNFLSFYYISNCLFLVSCALQC
jgi:hypothetical protein